MTRPAWALSADHPVAWRSTDEFVAVAGGQVPVVALRRDLDFDAPTRLGPLPDAMSPGGRWLRVPGGEPHEPTWQLVDLVSGRTLEHHPDVQQLRLPLRQRMDRGRTMELDAHGQTIRAWRLDDGEHIELDPGVNDIVALTVAP